MGIGMTDALQYLSGAITTGLWVAAIFFFRFWRKSGDSLFIYFFVAFLVFGFERLIFAVNGNPNGDEHALFYLLRLSGFILILLGILGKNRSTAKKAV